MERQDKTRDGIRGMGKMNYQWLIHGGDRNKWVWHYWRIYFEANCVLPRNLETVFLTESRPIPREWTPIKSATTGKMSFSGQLIKYLKICKSKYILYSMDDMFLLGQPQFDEIEKLVVLMQQRGIKMIKLFDNKHTKAAREHNPVDENGLHFYEFWRPYIISCQPSLWEREYFLSRLKNRESGAEFEIHGSTICKQNAYCHTDPMSIFPYKEGIRGGKIRLGSEHLFIAENLPKAKNDTTNQ
jgi:hypothetical protein